MLLYQDFILGAIATRPAAGSKGRRFTSTDTNVEYYDDGVTWQAISYAQSQVVNLTTDLGAKAPLASPTFTGTPAAPTPSTGDNSTKIATTAYVQAQGYGTSGGTVSSVGLTLPSWLSVSGSPVTTSGTLAVTAATGQTANLFLATPNGSTGAASLRAIVQADLPAQPVDIPCSLTGKPGAAAIVLIFTATRALSFAANFSGAYGTAGANPTSTAAYDVLKNGSSIGTVSISTSGVFTFTTASGTSKSLAAGDRLTITGPSSQDATLSDVSFTLTATR